MQDFPEACTPFSMPELPSHPALSNKCLMPSHGVQRPGPFPLRPYLSSRAMQRAMTLGQILRLPAGEVEVALDASILNYDLRPDMLAYALPSHGRHDDCPPRAMREPWGRGQI